MKEFKNYFLLIISILTTLLLFFIFTKPRIEQVKQGRQIIAQEKEKLMALTRKAAILSDSDEQILSEQVKKINFILPSEKSVEGLIFTLDRIANEASVSVSNLVFSPGLVSKKDKDKITTKESDSFAVNLVINGQTSDLKSFFEKLKGLLLAVKIKKLNISQPVTQEIRTADLILDVYYRPITLTLAKITEPINELTEREKKLLNEVESLALPEEGMPIIVPRASGTNPFVGLED